MRYDRYAASGHTVPSGMLLWTGGESPLRIVALYISLLMKTSGFRRILLYHSRSFEGRDNITVERNLSYMTPEDRLHRSHRGDFYADNLSFSSIFWISFYLNDQQLFVMIANIMDTTAVGGNAAKVILCSVGAARDGEESPCFVQPQGRVPEGCLSLWESQWLLKRRRSMWYCSFYNFNLMVRLTCVTTCVDGWT